MFDLTNLASVTFNNFNLKYGGVYYTIRTFSNSAEVSLNNCVVQKIEHGF
jgi:hypothetical protein